MPNSSERSPIVQFFQRLCCSALVFIDWFQYGSIRNVAVFLLIIGMTVGGSLTYVELFGQTIQITVIKKYVTLEKVSEQFKTTETDSHGNTVTKYHTKYRYESRYWIMTPTETFETNSSDWLVLLGFKASYETLEPNHRYSVRVIPWFGRRFLRDVRSDLGPVSLPSSDVNVRPVPQ